MFDFSSFSDLLIHFAKGVLIALGTLLLLRGNKKVRKKLSENRVLLDSGWVDPISKFISVVIFSFSSLLVLQTMGVNVTPLLAFGGFGAAAIGIVGRDLISNFSGGWLLHFTRPFLIRDEIEMPQKGLMGTVLQIGWNFTVIRAKNTQLIWVPNSTFMHEIVINQSQMSHRRIEESVLISVEDVGVISSLVEQIRSLFLQNADIDPEELCDVHVTGVSATAVEVRWTVHTTKTRYQEYMAVKQALLLDVFSLIQRAGVKMSYAAGQAHFVELKNLHTT